jgi:hypothetical protein
VTEIDGRGASDGSNGPKQPSVVPASVLLGLAAVLIVVVLIKPNLPSWLKLTIVVLALVVVVALLVYAVILFRETARRGRR